MEEIRARAVEGYYKLMRGGVEVAGLLIGERQDNTIRILAHQPFEIEYAYGPVFLLSPRDHAFLRKLAEDLADENAGSPRRVLGFYVSHSRGELSLKETEVGIFSEIFPHEWQTVLLLKPSRAPETPAAFFVREADGRVLSGRSHLEFELVPHMGERRERAVRRPRPEDPSLRALANASAYPDGQAAPRPAASPETGGTPPPALEEPRHPIGPDSALPPRAQAPPPPIPPAYRAVAAAAAQPVPWDEEPASEARASSPLRFAIPVIALLVLMVLGYLAYVALTAEPPQVVFYTRETGDHVEVVWQLSGIRDATSAVITIENNGETKTIDLLRDGQLSGSLADALLTHDAVVTLDVLRRDAPAIQQVARLMGSSAQARLREERAPVPEPSASEETSAAASGGVDEPVAGTLAETATSAPREAAPPEPSKPVAAEPPALVAEAVTPPEPVPAGSRPEARENAQAPPPAVLVPVPSDRILPAGPDASPQPSPSEPTSRGESPAAPLEQPAQRASAPPSPVSTPPAAGTTAAPVPSVSAPTVTPAKPAAAAKARAGRMIWTGQLRKNQSLQITGGDASQGAVNASLPGMPVRVNVLPGELTPQGLVVYTANPRYRDAAAAEEEPGPTNGWNRTRYRYDPARANSIIVTAIPNQTNRWQGVTVRNDDRTTNVIVIDWLADTGD